MEHISNFVRFGLLAGLLFIWPINASLAGEHDLESYLKTQNLPPASGVKKPLVKPYKGDDGLWHQTWFLDSFLNLREDFEETKAQGKRLAIVFEQRGCGYCIKMHKEVLAEKYINEYVRNNFNIIQINLWGDREVTDFDGKKLTEKTLAERWGIFFTPAIVFLKDDLQGLDGKWGRKLEVMRMALGIGPGTFYDVFTWIKQGIYKKDRNFQRFHLIRIAQREALKKAEKQTE